MDNDTVASSFLHAATVRLTLSIGCTASLGTGGATRGLRDYIAGQVRRAAVKADGSIDAAAQWQTR
jgi:hypothetical protein